MVPDARAATAHRAIAELNAQRAANGIPAGITENPTWSRECAAHDRYMALNHILTHDEVQGTPGYSSGGAFAGRNAVLIQDGNWDAGNPYETAPLHLDELLAPRLAVTGSADLDGYSCTVTFPGWTRADPAELTVYTYPGNGASIYSSEVAREDPWTPGDLAGIAQPARTGPNLIVFVDAPGQTPLRNSAALSGATLNGPSGPVTVKVVDGSTPVPNGPLPTLFPYLSPGGIVIPQASLQPSSTYHAHVVVTFAGVQTPYDWSFTTKGVDPQSSLTNQGAVLSFMSSSPAAIRVTLKRANGAHAPSITIGPGRSAHPRLSPGAWEACGHQPTLSPYAGYDHCLSIAVTGEPTLRFGASAVDGQRLSFPLQFSAVLRGRQAMLTITPVTLHCTHRVCTSITGVVVVRTITLHDKALSFPLPPAGHGMRLALSTSAFQLAGAPWDAARAVSQTFVR
jgi:hypothetical protein